MLNVAIAPGNDFAPGIKLADSVPYNSTFLLVGGSSQPTSSSVYMYQYKSDSWTELEAKLRAGREEVTAMAVKRSMFPEC